MSASLLNALMSLLREAPASAREGILKQNLKAHPELAEPSAIVLLRQFIDAQNALLETGKAAEELKKLLDQVAESPNVVTAVVGTNNGHYVVPFGDTWHTVGVHPSLKDEQFEIGDVVALTQDGNVIVARLKGYRPTGRVAQVMGWHGDRLLVEYLPDQPLQLDVSRAVRDAKPREGDKVLYHERWKLALEVVERCAAPKIDEFEPVLPHQIGGLDDVIDELLLAIEGAYLRPDLAAALELERIGGVVLEGPPGVGKTLLMRALVTFLRDTQGKRVVFRDVPPGSWRSEFFGVSERLIVKPIKDAERLLDDGEAELVILFYDDLDTLGSRSAEFTNRIDSRVMNALLHALDGLHERGGVLVAGTTNRVDLLDEALIRPGRFGDLILKIGRPDRDAARAVFRCHLRPSVKFWTNSHAATPSEMVEQSIDAALGRLFADSDPKDALAELVLAGGQRRLVWGREVVSGAMIANIVNRAKRRALRRSLIGPEGLVPEDLAAAADDELDSIAERFADPVKAREILGDRTLPVTRGEPRRHRIA